jgi:hypothetical protein
VLGFLLDRGSELSIRNGLLFHKQLICPMMDYACSMLSYAARSHVWKLQLLQSKYLRFATDTDLYVGNGQIREDLKLPFFANRIQPLRFSTQTLLVLGTA